MTPKRKPTKPRTKVVKPLTPFAERIKAALAHGYVELCELEYFLFPVDKYPNAFRSSVNGGPPGCRWMLVAALHRFKVPISNMGGCNAASLVGPWPGTFVPVETVTAAQLRVLISIAPSKGKRK